MPDKIISTAARRVAGDGSQIGFEVCCYSQSNADNPNMLSIMSKITALMAVVCAFGAFANAGVPVFVMLPLDTITLQNTLNDPQQLKANLYTLKQGGVTGVMSDTWWGLTEPSPQQYNVRTRFRPQRCAVLTDSVLRIH